MTLRVRLNGEYVDRVATVSDVVDSTILRAEGWSGDYQASCTFAADRDFAAPWFRRHAVWETVEDGIVTWGGLLSEPSLSGDSWSLNAYGFGSAAAEWPALASGPVPSASPDAVLDYGTSLTPPLPIRRYATIIGASDLGLEPGEVIDISTLLDRAGQSAGGKYWWVDSFKEVSLVVADTTPTWMLTPGSGYLGTADDNFLTHLYGLYVSSLDINGQPDGWSLVLGSDDTTAGEYGPRKEVADLKGLGLLTSTPAQANIDGQFELRGARMNYTNPIDLTELNLLRPGWGAGSPMNVRAGHMLRIPDVWDTRTSATAGSSIDVVLGEVTRVHAEQRAVARPVGFTARSHVGALRAAQPKRSAVVKA